MLRLHSRSTVRRGEENARDLEPRARIRILLTYFSRLSRARVKLQKGTLMTFLFIQVEARPRKNSFVSPRVGLRQIAFPAERGSARAEVPIVSL